MFAPEENRVQNLRVFWGSRSGLGMVILVSALANSTESRADVGPPVKIVMPPNTTVAAVSGEEYHGSVELMVHEAGRLDDVEISGTGWRILEINGDEAVDAVAGQVVTLHFHAVPQNENEPLRVEATFDGRTIRRSFRLSRAEFAKMGKPRRVEGIDANGRVGPVQPKLSTNASNTAGQTIRFHGRIAYMRPTVDGGPQDMLVGADTLYFEIVDDDSPDPFDETIYSGYTDFYGNFDVTVTWDDCDITGCDDPDIYLYFETDNGVVNVQDTDILETDYSWDTQDRVIDDFTGNDVDFGTVLPANRSEDPAIHIHNSIMRAHRFILTRDNGNHVEELDVLWPEDQQGSGAFYDDGDKEIHIAPSRQWREDTHIHEYGHHFIYTQSQGSTPEYCNMICDCEPQVCAEVSGCGHCIWCPETDHDAWNEGWPNWLADVVTRSIPGDYAGYMTLYSRSQEITTNTCTTSAGATMPNPSPLLTEGFAGALLRDIEDSTDEDQDNRDVNPADGTPDDTDGDGVPDCQADAMSLGIDEIFAIVKQDRPTTIAAFMAAFRDRYPEHDQDLWSTVRNVTPALAFPTPVPQVTSQSEGCRSYVEGENLGLIAQGNGRLLKYQWKRDGVNVVDGGRIRGATAAELHIDGLTPEDAGSYNCMVSTCDQTLSVFSIPVNVQVFASRGSGTNGGSWGRNDGGGLGRGTVDLVGNQYTSTIPAPMVVLNDAVKIAGGHWSSFALRGDGTVWGWGWNGYAGLGRTDVTFTPNPAPVPGVENAVAISAGTDFAAALRKDGKVVVWGANYFGTHGNGQVYGYSVAPLEVPNMDCVISMATGAYHMAVVKSDGRVWTWGYNGEGNLGKGTVGGWDPTPAEVPGISNARAVAAGYYHSLVLLEDGTVKGFGRNLEGQMGDGTTGNYRPSPITVPGLTNVRALRGGAFHSFAILQDGTARGWGDNGGKLGDGTTNRNPVPLQPLDVGTISDIACGYYHTLFLRADRTVWVTGWNAYGELGPRPYPEPLKPLPVRGISNAIAIGAGNGTSFVAAPGMGAYVAVQPADKSTTVGQNLSFSITAFGTPDITYQWSRNGSDLLNGGGFSGVNTATLTLNPVAAAMGGDYAVRIQNLFGFDNSKTAKLTVACAAGDATCDGAIDVRDAANLADCLNGPGQPRPAACAVNEFGGFDVNNDNDVDMRDAAAFQNCFAGPNAIDPACANP